MAFSKFCLSDGQLKISLDELYKSETFTTAIVSATMINIDNDQELIPFETESRC